MKKTLWMSLWLAVSVLGIAALCFGHACDDPWRPNPSQEVSSGSIPGGPGGPEVPSLPPPPPPAPDDPGAPGGPIDSGVPGAENLNPGLENRLPGDGQAQSDETSPDNIVLIPEATQLKIVGRKGEFRTYVVNRSPRDLFDVKMQAYSPAFETEIDPGSIKRLVPGEKDYYTVKLKLKEEWKTGKFPMDFKVTSRGATIYEGNLEGPSASAAPQNLGMDLSHFPASVVKTGKFEVHLKNNVFNELNNIMLAVKSSAFNCLIKPASIKKLSPGQVEKFEVQMTVKKGVAPGKQKLTLEARTSSRNVFADQEVILEVKKK